MTPTLLFKFLNFPSDFCKLILSFLFPSSSAEVFIFIDSANFISKKRFILDIFHSIISQRSVLWGNLKL